MFSKLVFIISSSLGCGGINFLMISCLYRKLNYSMNDFETYIYVGDNRNYSY